MKRFLVTAITFLSLAAPVFAEDAKTPPSPAVAEPAVATPAIAEPTVAAPADPVAPTEPKAPEIKVPEAKGAPAKAPDLKASKEIDEKREGKMRDRWRKMTPEQRDEMRQKAERRLQERFERLSQQEQGQVNNILAEMDKLSKEQRSVLMAMVHQKSYKSGQQKKKMEELNLPKKPAAQ